MKTRVLIVLMALVLCLSLLSACDLLGGKSEAERQQEYYEQQIEAFNQAQEAEQKRQEELREALETALQEWADATYGEGSNVEVVTGE